VLTLDVAHLKANRTRGATKALDALKIASSYLAEASVALKTTDRKLADLLDMVSRSLS